MLTPHWLVRVPLPQRRSYQAICGNAFSLLAENTLAPYCMIILGVKPGTFTQDFPPKKYVCGRLRGSTVPRPILYHTVVLAEQRWKYEGNKSHPGRRMIKLLRFATPPTLPYADLLQLVSPAFDQQERNICHHLNRQPIEDDQLHERVRVIYFVWRLHGKFEVGVFRALVLFQIIEPISPPRTTSEGTIDGMREERPNVTIPFLSAEEYPHA